MRRILIPLLMSMSLVAACTTTPAPPKAPGTATAKPATAKPSATTKPTAHAAADCGTFDLGQGEQLPEPAARCLAEAVRAKHPARLEVTAPTTEGDPIPVTYTPGADGRVEVRTDSRQDAFGARIVTRRTCSGPIAVPRLDFAKCSEPVPVPR